MIEKTPEEEEERLNYLINKWSKVLDFTKNESLSTCRQTAMLIEPQEQWVMPEEVEFKQEYCCEFVDDNKNI